MEKKNILVVDNTTSIVSPWKQPVKMYFNMIEVVGGFEAVSKLKQMPDISAVLVNLSLPGVNGLDVVIKIRDTFKKIPIVVIASKNDVKFVKNATMYGIHGYLLMPFSNDQILGQLAKVTKTNLAELANALMNETEEQKKKQAEAEAKKSEDEIDVPQLYYDGQSYLAREEIDEAIETFNKVLGVKRLKDTWRRFIEDSYFQLGRCYMKKNDYGKALETFSTFITRAPNSDNNKNAYLLIGECYENSNKIDKAIAVYKKVMNMVPMDSVTTQARKRVKRLEGNK